MYSAPAIGALKDRPESVPIDELRAIWLATVVFECQHVAGRCLNVTRDELTSILLTFVDRLPDPQSHIEHLILRGILLDVAHRSGRVLHGSLHLSDRPCDLSDRLLLERLAESGHEDSRIGFRDWASAFIDALNRSHPPSLGSSIGRLVRRDFNESWSLTRLARRFSATPSEINSAFQRTFGRSVRDYQRSVRLAAALEVILQEKIEAVALRIGFRSKKNFYTAFTKIIGLRPSEFRRLPDAERQAIKERVLSRTNPR
jgi:AraC-like DNA-binding protein